MLFLRTYVSKVGFILLGLLFLHLFDPYNLAAPLGYLVVVAFFLLKKTNLTKSFDTNALVILFFGIIYSLFEFLNLPKGIQYVVIESIFPVTFYLVGKELVIGKMKQIQIMNLLIALALVFSLPSLLSVLKTLATSGFIAKQREVPNIWTGSLMTATNASGYLIYLLVLPGIIIATKKDMSLKTKLLLTFVFLVTLICSFRLGSRTCLVLATVSILLGLAQLVISNNLFKNIKLMFVLAVLIFLAINYLKIDLKADYLSTLGDRLNDKNTSSISTGGNRTGLWSTAIQKMIKNPLGWDGYYAHNTWLDIARVGGILSLLLFMINNFICIKNLIKLFSVKPENIGITAIFSLFFFAAFLFFFGEPTILGHFYSLTFFFMLQGVLQKTIELRSENLN